MLVSCLHSNKLVTLVMSQDSQDTATATPKATAPSQHDTKTCSLILTVGEHRQCDLCDKDVTLLDDASKSVWVSCTDCSYDECIDCVLSPRSHGTIASPTHVHKLKPFTLRAALTLHCSLCAKRLKSAPDMRHRYCPTCNDMDNMQNWYFECTACHHRRPDVKRPTFQLVCTDTRQQLNIPFPPQSTPPSAPLKPKFESKSESGPATAMAHSSRGQGGYIFFQSSATDTEKMY